MTKFDLIKEVQQAVPHYPPQDLAHAVNIIFDALVQSLKNNNRIEIRGWGSFSIKQRQGRTGHNPKSGISFTVPPHRVPFFKASKELQRLINS